MGVLAGLRMCVNLDHTVVVDRQGVSLCSWCGSKAPAFIADQCSKRTALRASQASSKNSFCWTQIARGWFLCAGRLSLALGSPDTMLPVILGPPDGWKGSGLQPASSGLGNGGRGKPRASTAKSQFPALQQEFRYVAQVRPIQIA